MQASPRADARLQPGEVVAGKYRIDRVLGAGAMGTVVAATHLQLGRPVALKFMVAEALEHPQATARFLREARAAAVLRSENVARVLDVGTLDDGAPYIVMEYLEGTDLAALLERSGPLDSVTAVDHVLDASRGLAEAHARGIVHRDLKPANLFLTRRPDGAPLVKVLDFGISKMAVGDGAGSFGLTQPSSLLGSPSYMSPEQMIGGRGVDARSDLWSLGVILYELLSGRAPFDADSLIELGMKVVNEPHASLAQARPGVPAELSAVVDRCLRKQAGDRFANLAELAWALAPHGSASARAAATEIAAVLGISAAPAALEPAAPPAPKKRPTGWRWLAVAVGTLTVVAGGWWLTARPAATTAPVPTAPRSLAGSSVPPTPVAPSAPAVSPPSAEVAAAPEPARTPNLSTRTSTKPSAKPSARIVGKPARARRSPPPVPRRSTPPVQAPGPIITDI